MGLILGAMSDSRQDDSNGGRGINKPIWGQTELAPAQLEAKSGHGNLVQLIVGIYWRGYGRIGRYSKL